MKLILAIILLTGCREALCEHRGGTLIYGQDYVCPVDKRFKNCDFMGVNPCCQRVETFTCIGGSSIYNYRILDQWTSPL